MHQGMQDKSEGSPFALGLRAVLQLSEMRRLTALWLDWASLCQAGLQLEEKRSWHPPPRRLMPIASPGQALVLMVLPTGDLPAPCLIPALRPLHLPEPDRATFRGLHFAHQGRLWQAQARFLKEPPLELPGYLVKAAVLA
ncbi:hypothetical protein Q669_00690 [Labrenzia sp. C1B10]|nr:hypothetical protein Q669_00690 [Labrenzia sp. C1B10]ERS00925.1 hypothetical protein Q675_08955 [Labrenzia sp. C1B70]